MSCSSSLGAIRALELLAAGVLFSAISFAPGQAAAQGAPQQGNGGAGAGVMLLGAAVSGIIDKIAVADGSHVDAGQLLMQINCDPLQVDIKVRAAALAALQAALNRAQNGSRPDEIAIGEAAVGVARARAEEAQDAYDRLARLTVGMTVTQEQLFHSQREARVATAQLDDSQKRLALLRAGARPEDIAEALAKRDEAQAQLEESEARLDECSIHAPASGTVQIVATLGEYISTAVPVTLVRLTADRSSR